MFFQLSSMIKQLAEVEIIKKNSVGAFFHPANLAKQKVHYLNPKNGTFSNKNP